MPSTGVSDDTAKPSSFWSAALQVRLPSRHQVAVRGRIECRGVDPVQDAGHTVATAAQDRVEALAVLAGHDLLCIRRTHRAHDVTVDQATRHEVELPADAGAESVLDQPAFAEACGGQRIRAELSLIRQVVDREHRRDVAERVFVKGPQVVRDQRRMPVVAVHHRRLPSRDFAQVLHQGQHTTREEDEATVVIAVAIDAVPLERRRDVEQINRGRTVGHFPDAQLFGTLAERQKGGRDRSLDLHAPFTQLAIVRHHHPHIVPIGTQGSWERPRHVGQSPGLDQRCRLGGDEEDVHAEAVKG
jgi:hypothetical protein